VMLFGVCCASPASKKDSTLLSFKVTIIGQRSVRIKPGSETWARLPSSNLDPDQKGWFEEKNNSGAPRSLIPVPPLAGGKVNKRQDGRGTPRIAQRQVRISALSEMDRAFVHLRGDFSYGSTASTQRADYNPKKINFE